MGIIFIFFCFFFNSPPPLPLSITLLPSDGDLFPSAKTRVPLCCREPDAFGKENFHFLFFRQAIVRDNNRPPSSSPLPSPVVSIPSYHPLPTQHAQDRRSPPSLVRRRAALRAKKTAPTLYHHPYTSVVHCECECVCVYVLSFPFFIVVSFQVR